MIESVKASLNHELYENATFLCEKLHAQVQNEDVKHLLAQCYLGKLSIASKLYNVVLGIGEDKAYKAYEVLKDCQSAKNRYKFALTCIKLSRYNDAELALTGARLPQNSRNPSFVMSNNHLNLNENRHIPNGASGYYLLGFVLEKQYKH